MAELAASSPRDGFLDRPTRRSLFAITVLWLALALYVWQTAGQLPKRVATHFNAAGQADGWMSRAGHVQFTLLMSLGLAVFIVGAFAVLRRCGGWGLNIPRKAYWLAPERRDETFAFIQRQGVWLAVLLLGLFAGIHHSILAANTRIPAALDEGNFGWIMGGFVFAICVWTGRFLGRFWRTPR